MEQSITYSLSLVTRKDKLPIEEMLKHQLGITTGSVDLTRRTLHIRFDIPSIATVTGWLEDMGKDVDDVPPPSIIDSGDTCLISFHVPSIMCASCTGSIEDTLRKRANLIRVNANAVSKMVTIVCHKPSLKSLNQQLVIINPDLEINPEVNRKESGRPSVLKRVNTKDNKQNLKKSMVAGSFGLLLLLLNIFVSVIIFPIEILLIVIGVGVIYYAGFDIFKNAYQQLFKAKSLTADVLFSFSTITALTLAIVSVFVPIIAIELSMVYFIFASRHLGKYIEETFKNKITRRIKLSDGLPSMANRVDKFNKALSVQRYFEMPSAEINVGEVILISAGETVPLDGEFVSGQAMIFRTMVNGQLFPETASKQNLIYAGMKVDSGQLYVRVKKTKSDSYLSQLDKNLIEASYKKTKTEKTLSTIIRYFIPTVIILTIVATAIAVPLYGSSIALHLGLSMLVGACPCTLGYIAPLAIRLGLNKNADFGVTISNPDAIEDVNRVKTVAFDLNGTLTTGKPEFGTIECPEGEKPLRILKLIYDLEMACENRNLIGGALLSYVRGNLGETIDPCVVEHLSDRNQAGISATIEGKKYLLGNYQLLSKHGVYVKSTPNVVYLCENGQVIGNISYRDPLRRDARILINQLKRKGKRVLLCTGSDANTANRYAETLGIASSDVITSCHGAEAKSIALGLQMSTLCFVGDASNDALLLKKSLVGIAVKNADEISKQNADVIINENQLLPILHYFDISKKTSGIVKQSLLMTLSYNLAVPIICLAISLSCGMMAPGAMALFMAVQAVIVLANISRIYLFKGSHIDMPSQSIEDVVEVHSKFDRKPRYEPSFDPLFAPQVLPENISVKAKTDDKGKLCDIKII